METLRRILDPLTSRLPEGMQDYGLVVIFLAAILVVLVPVAWFQRRALKAIVARTFQRPTPVEPPNLEEDLGVFPPPAGPGGPKRVMIEGVPAQLQLVVVAPMGMKAAITEPIEEILNQVVWGLGAVAQQDRPQVRMWPPQLSAHGFPAAFHRLVKKREPDGQPSNWVLVAGHTPPRPRPFLLGLGLWTDQATTIGRVNLEPREWVGLLRIETVETRDELDLTPGRNAPLIPPSFGRTGQGDNSAPLSRGNEQA